MGLEMLSAQFHGVDADVQQAVSKSTESTRWPVFRPKPGPLPVTIISMALSSAAQRILLLMAFLIRKSSGFSPK